MSLRTCSKLTRLRLAARRRKGEGVQPRYAQASGALLGKLSHFHTDIYGNWDFRFPPFMLR